MINFDNINNTNELDIFLNNNIQSIFDFFNSDYTELKKEKKKIRGLISTKYQIFTDLDFSKSYNSAFILLLFDYTERFKLINPARLILNIIENNELSIGHRLEAAKLFLFTKKTEEYITKSDDIFNKLEFAFKNEEDNEIKTLLTLSNYFSLVFQNVGEINKNIIKELFSKTQKLKSSFSFLNFEFVEKLLSINVDDFTYAREQFQLIIDALLSKKEALLVSKVSFLIEENTEYADLLKQINTSFEAIQNLSKIEYQKIADNSIFYSLQRGVGILTEKEQLLAYMNSYGKMHYAKLQSAFSELQPDFFNKKIIIIDWACGQALASISYFDYLKRENKIQTIENITLIEPSEIAIKRGTLHLKKINSNTNITTINKDLDKLENSDLIKDNNVKLHLFSNILDIDFFSMAKLLDIISSNYKGENYFICVSPYITDLKKNRIDSFVNYFQKHDKFEMIKSINNKENNWCSYGSPSWSRVLRIFKVTL